MFSKVLDIFLMSNSSIIILLVIHFQGEKELLYSQVIG
nr:MAG TPA: hypothetical protein [Caudoviricetes sp.]